MAFTSYIWVILSTVWNILTVVVGYKPYVSASLTSKAKVEQIQDLKAGGVSDNRSTSSSGSEFNRERNESHGMSSTSVTVNSVCTQALILNGMQVRVDIRNEIDADMGRTVSRFIPYVVLRNTLSKEKVLQIVATIDKLETGLEKLIPFIMEKALRVFAILVQIRHPELIDHFYKFEFGDSSLPVRLDAIKDRYEEYSCTPNNGTPTQNEHPFTTPPWLSPTLFESFCDKFQWPFCSPVFEKPKFKYEFNKATLLPFVKAGKESSTFFSTVREIWIHREYLSDFNSDATLGLSTDKDGHHHVAIKVLKRPAAGMLEDEFQNMVKAEVATLMRIRGLKHTHLINAIAYYTRGEEHCVIFPWADGGNLRDYWEGNPDEIQNPVHRQDYIKWMFIQFCGLAKGIMDLHGFGASHNTRHGDLKPENILCFSKGKSVPNQCTLVIADVGLSKRHDKMTEFRQGPTTTAAGTIMYEPPEAEVGYNAPRSRRYDVWSLGCIYLEFVIWYLYGKDELNRFRNNLAPRDGTGRFFKIATENNSALLGNEVIKWIDHILADQRCRGRNAVKSLVELIQTRLLVPHVDSPARLPASLTADPGSPDSQKNTSSSEPNHDVPRWLVRTATEVDTPNRDSRASSQEMHDEMQKIINRAFKDEQWLNWNAPRTRGPPNGYGATLTPDAKPRPAAQENEYRFTPLNDEWKYTPDLHTAGQVIVNADPLRDIKRIAKIPRLCGQCRSLRLWLPEYAFYDSISDLKEKSKHCDLCKLLHDRIREIVPTYSVDHQFRIVRINSTLVLDDRRSQPVISIYALPSGDTLKMDNLVPVFQPGHPELFAPGSSRHTKLLTEWIRSCDQSHTCSPKQNAFLPTRVLDVGDSECTTVRLFCGTQDQKSPENYIALSHRWGKPTQHHRFCTTRNNIAEYQNGIKDDALPHTFLDAVKVTRSLRVRYLWIDSICIIQNDAEDWKIESQRMEQVFSCAYVTIAASCANGTNDGFLKPRPKRAFVQMQKEDGLIYYLSQPVDDFNRDVEQGELNKRGWVLQERALSRRTIYFAINQTYWECGEGVRCETLTKMENKKASFLGDSNFPNSVEAYVKGMKIEFFQNIYELYSKLSLTFDKDRPVAIRGLEKRLIKALHTTGGYGVFDCYLYRSLLWQSSGDTLKRTSSSRDDKIPSWSWMAYTGGIKYMDVPFGEVSWGGNIQSPFTATTNYGGVDDVMRKRPLEMKAMASHMAHGPLESLLYDDATQIPSGSIKCVVLGSTKISVPHQPRKHYVLVVSAVTDQGNDTYERIGVGTLEEDQVIETEPEAILII